MQDITLQELLDIVSQIQYEIYEQTDCEYYFISLSSNGDSTVVEFMDIQIWNDGDDMRKYIEETDEYEPIDVYLRREINNEIRKLSVIRL